jgi:hypothetical protein
MGDGQPRGGGERDAVRHDQVCAKGPQAEQHQAPSPGGPVEQAACGHGGEHSLFVGDLDQSVGDAALTTCFRSRYPSVRSAKVICDPASGRSKGFGFVRFGSLAERDEALATMTGTPVGPSERAIRVSLAQPRRQVPGQNHGGIGGYEAMAMYGGGPVPARYAAGPIPIPIPGSPPSYRQGAAPVDGGEDPHNTTVFVGGLDPVVSEQQLRAVFSRYGELVYVKIPPGKNCGFVQYVLRPCAELALVEGHGLVLGRQAVRLSWGRSNQARAGYAAAAAATSAGYGLAMGGYGGPAFMVPGAGYEIPYMMLPPGAFYGYPGASYGEAMYNHPYAAQLAAQYAHMAQQQSAAHAAAASQSDATSPTPAGASPPGSSAGSIYGAGSAEGGMATHHQGGMPSYSSDAAGSVAEATTALRAMLLGPDANRGEGRGADGDGLL